MPEFLGGHARQEYLCRDFIYNNESQKKWDRSKRSVFRRGGILDAAFPKNEGEINHFDPSDRRSAHAYGQFREGTEIF
jgi:hypothetical protein